MEEPHFARISVKAGISLGDRKRQTVVADFGHAVYIPRPGGKFSLGSKTTPNWEGRFSRRVPRTRAHLKAVLKGDWKHYA